VLLVVLAACLRPAVSPDVGPCAEYPDGVYEFGQIGIGTCLAGPTDLAFVGDRLMVANMNPWGDFTGGSLLSLDAALLPSDGGMHGVTELDPVALPLPTFSGPMALAPELGTLLVANRLSDARTREEADRVYFVDVTDPAAPSLRDPETVQVGADPNALLYDPATQYAYVVDRTDHAVSVLDLGASPPERLPPGGPARVVEEDFVDTDGSGSKAEFVSLEATDGEDGAAHDWTARWSAGTLRLWVPAAQGVYRMTSSGDGSWTRSGLERDLAVRDSAGLVSGFEDPWVTLVTNAELDTSLVMFFQDEGAIRTATADETSALVGWEVDALPVLQGDEEGWDPVVGGPAGFYPGDAWYLYYDGGDGQTQSIGLATSVDGSNWIRGTAPLLSRDGASVEDPFVVYDGQLDRWRMWFTVVDAEGWGIGEAWSEDLYTWTDQATRWAPTGSGAAAPAVTWFGGTYHLYYDRPGLDRAVHEAVSVDGTNWVDAGVAFEVDEPQRGVRRRVAVQAAVDNSFTLVDSDGDVHPVPLSGGTAVTDSTQGFSVLPAVGHWLGPADIGSVAEGGVSLGSVSDGTAWLALLDGDGAGTIRSATVQGRGFAVDGTAAVAPGADWRADAVESPVVVELDGQQLMYFAGRAAGVSRIGRATSADGVRWTVDAEPVVEAVESWESVEMVPTSAAVGDDGRLHLWYSASDGEDWVVGELVSADGVSFTHVEGVEDAWAFGAGTPGDWDDSGVRDAWVRWDAEAGIYRLWYAGFDGLIWQIGYAERAPGGVWSRSVDADGESRPVLVTGSGSFGVTAIRRPVVVEDGDDLAMWYTGEDGGEGRVGRAVVGAAGDRVWRDLNLPTPGDTWGFATFPAREDEESISLRLTLGGSDTAPRGCEALAHDEGRGFVYVGCKSAPYVYVIDVRDDAGDGFWDQNYLDVEALLTVETNNVNTTSLRALAYDAERDLLWFLNDSPESLGALSLAQLEDDDDVEILTRSVDRVLALPRAIERDEGTATESNVGPGQLLFHPDGQHLFVSNFNHNSVVAFDLSLGATGLLVAEADALGENPWALRLSPDGSRLVVANYAGEVVDEHASSTLVVLDGDPESPSFLTPLGWVGNR